MALDSYDGLKESIEGHLVDGDIVVDDLIDLAEARHKREVRIREMLTREDLAIASGVRYIDLPEDFLDLKYLRILIPSGSRRRYLPGVRQVTIHELSERSDIMDGPPKCFALHEQIELDREADQDYTGEIFYYTELTALSDENTSNALLTRAPDVYLYAALSASAPFLLHDERVPMWEQLYTNARDELNRSQWEGSRGGPMLSRVVGATP